MSRLHRVGIKVPQIDWDTGWKTWGGEYGKTNPQTFQLVRSNIAPILWRGSEPPTKAGAHAYSIHQGHKVIILRLFWRHPGLKTAGYSVGCPDVMIFPDHTQIYNVLSLKIKLLT